MRPSTMREANCDLVLRTLERHGPNTRAELARHTSLTPQALGSIMSDLTRDRMVRVLESESGGRGRPSAVYAVDPSAGYWLGISVQWRSVLLAVADATGSIMARGRINHLGPSMSAILERAAERSHELLDSVPGAADRLRAVGLSVQGMVDPSAGVAIESECWPDRDVSPGVAFEQLTGWTTSIDSAARATARAEVERSHSEQGLVAVLYISHDPVLVLVQDGVLLEGARGLGGSMAHLPVPGASARCECGRRGCMTTVASGSAVVRRYRKESGRRVERAPQVIDAARAGDPVAKAALADYRDITAQMTATLLQYAQPRALIVSGLVGGASSRGAGRLVDTIREHLAGTTLAQHLDIAISPYELDAHVWGALLLARRACGLRPETDVRGAVAASA